MNEVRMLGGLSLAALLSVFDALITLAVYGLGATPACLSQFSTYLTLHARAFPSNLHDRNIAKQFESHYQHGAILCWILDVSDFSVTSLGNILLNAPAPAAGNFPRSSRTQILEPRIWIKFLRRSLVRNGCVSQPNFHLWLTDTKTPHPPHNRSSGLVDIMPMKRKIDDFDPNKSDSADSTYGVSASKNTRSRPSKSQRTKPSRKRQRRDFDGSDDISDDDDDVSEDSFHQEPTIDEEATDYDDVTGRPKRKAKKKRPTYQEPDSEDDVEDSASERLVTPRKRKISRSKIVKLKLSRPTPNPTRRSTRARSGSASARPSSAGLPSGARRSSRIAHDDTEPIIALTDSGHHANIVRPGTRSPPSGGRTRPRVGGKGPKKGPATSVVYEEENSSGQTKSELLEEDDLHQIDRVEVAASREDLGEDEEDPQSQPPREPGTHTRHLDSSIREPVGIDEGAVIPESGDERSPARDEDEDEDPVSQPRRTTRRVENITVDSKAAAAEDGEPITVRRALRSTAEKGKARSSQKTGREESSDFEPAADEAAEENISDSEAAESSPRKADDSSSNGRRNTRAAKARSRSRRNELSDEDEGVVADELAEELEDLTDRRARRGRRTNIIYEDKPQTRKRKPVDYRILRPDQVLPVEEDDDPADAATPSRRPRGGGGGVWQRSLYSTYGPFGGAGGPPPVFGGPGGVAAAGGVDSDSSDDEVQQRPRAIGYGGAVGMTPTTGPQGFGLLQPQTHNVDPLQGPSGTPANVGKVKDKQALADADPLGIDQNVNFDSVGGLQGHIDQLKEMVSLPLLYPEIFQRFHVTPPRGVLFHGPPGTGKTLLARALATSVSSGGRKVAFYMRKGGDALSKWVGEAERNLKILFEEARKTQPSIIFFDEIDGQ